MAKNLEGKIQSRIVEKDRAQQGALRFEVLWSERIVR